MLIINLSNTPTVSMSARGGAFMKVPLSRNEMEILDRQDGDSELPVN